MYKKGLAINSQNSIKALKNIEMNVIEELKYLKQNKIPIFIVGKKSMNLLKKELDLDSFICENSYIELYQKLSEFKNSMRKILYLTGNLSEIVIK